MTICSILENHMQEVATDTTFILTEWKSSPRAELVRFKKIFPATNQAVYEQRPGAIGPPFIQMSIETEK